MAGTAAGGKAAANTNKAKYGADFYARIGAKGGKKGKTGGFFANRKLASVAGALGGKISRRNVEKVPDWQRDSYRRQFKKQLEAAKND